MSDQIFWVWGLAASDHRVTSSPWIGSTDQQPERSIGKPQPYGAHTDIALLEQGSTAHTHNGACRIPRTHVVGLAGRGIDGSRVIRTRGRGSPGRAPDGAAARAQRRPCRRRSIGEKHQGSTNSQIEDTRMNLVALQSYRQLAPTQRVPGGSPTVRTAAVEGEKCQLKEKRDLNSLATSAQVATG